MSTSWRMRGNALMDDAALSHDAGAAGPDQPSVRPSATPAPVRRMPGPAVAVTVVSWIVASTIWVWEKEGKIGAKANGNASRRALEIQVFMSRSSAKALTVVPDSALASRLPARACNHLVGRYPGWWNNLHRLPKRMFKRSVAVMEAESREIRPLTVAGAAQVRFAVDGKPSCFPLNCGV